MMRKTPECSSRVHQKHIAGTEINILEFICDLFAVSMHSQNGRIVFGPEVYFPHLLPYQCGILRNHDLNDFCFFCL